MNISPINKYDVICLEMLVLENEILITNNHGLKENYSDHNFNKWYKINYQVIVDLKNVAMT